MPPPQEKKPTTSPSNIAGADARPAAADLPAGRTAHLRIGDVDMDRPIEPGQKSVKFTGVKLPAGPAKIEAWIATGDGTVGVRFVEILNLGEPIS
jgi:hypothetical protein